MNRYWLVLLFVLSFVPATLAERNSFENDSQKNLQNPGRERSKSIGTDRGFSLDTIAVPHLYEKLDVFSEILGMIERNYDKKINRRELVYSAIKGMIDLIDDQSLFLDPSFMADLKSTPQIAFGKLGLELTRRQEAITVITAIKKSDAWNKGILPGDEIVEVDSHDVGRLDMTEFYILIRSLENDRIGLTLKRAGLKIPAVTIKREIIISPPLRVERVDGVAVIEINAFTSGSSDEIEQIIQKQETPLDGIVFDLRNNAGGIFEEAVAVADLLLGKGKIVAVVRSLGKQQEKSITTRDGVAFSGPVSVLVNRGTAGSAEVLAWALKDNDRVKIVGVSSFGKGTIQTLFECSDGAGVKVTVGSVRSPKGSLLESGGIIPDIVVPSSSDPAVHGLPYTDERNRPIVESIKAIRP